MTPTRLVTIILGVVLIVSILGIVVLAVIEHQIPEVLTTVAVGDLTGLLGLLAPREAVNPGELTTPAPGPKVPAA